MRRALAVAAFLVLSLAAGPPGSDADAAGVAAGRVDTAAAAKMISQYRAAHGLAPVKVEARLMKIATTHAEKMATSDRLDHVLPGEGSFPQRINSGGYEAAVAAENIGAGYGTLDAAMTGWENSPPHQENLLRPDVTEIGIALYSTPVGQYHTYWSLVLARPAAPLQTGVNAGPSVFAPNVGSGITIGPFSIFGGGD
jgi:uncharacterized protein YkwD